MALEKVAEMRPDNQPVENVGGERNAKQPVMQITKPPHNASSAKPEVMASSVLKSKIITSAFYAASPVTPERILPQFPGRRPGGQIKKRGRTASL
jgi:hypothetical protein